MVLAERGARETGMELPRESLESIAMLSSGDGRTLLNLVEFTAALPEDKRAPDELRKHLPRDTPVVTPQQRDQELRRRVRAAQRRRRW